MNILDKIVAYKKEQVIERKELYPQKLLEKSLYYSTPAVSLKEYLAREDKSGIIAEFKRKSPSKGMINAYAKVEDTSISYMQAGASALSVLTDDHFFGGSNKDLQTARKFNFCPILRKDFVVDEYQIYEARSIGADAILLIAEILDESQIKQFTALAKSLGLEVLCEVHSKPQLDKLNDAIDLVGINNRNLDTFDVDIKTSFSLIEHIPADMMKVSESGINNPEIVFQLKKVGFNGFLIGEYFMQSAHPGRKCKKFVNEINRLETVEKLK